MNPARFIERYGIYLLLLVSVFAASVRYVRLDEGALWLDEAFSAWFSEQSWQYLWHELPQYETNPPAYYMMLKAWRALAGSSEFALRLPSAIASVAVVLLVGIAGRIIGGTRRGWAIGLTAAMLCAAWQFQIAYAVNARAYAFGSLGVALMLVGTLELICDPSRARVPLLRMPREAPRTALGLAAIALGSGLTLWSHLIGVIPVGLFWLFLLALWAIRHRFDRRLFWSLAASGIVSLAIYAPYLPTFIELATHDREDFSGIGFLQEPSFRWLAGLTSRAVGQRSFALGDAQAAVDAFLIALGILGFWRASRVAGAEHVWVFALIVLLTGGVWLSLVAITYTIQPVLIPRVLIFVQPTMFLLLAGIPWVLTRHRGAIAAALLLYVTIGALRPPTAAIPADRTYNEMVAAIAGSDAADAPVLVIPYYAEVGLHYYAERLGAELDLRPYPEDFRLPNRPVPTIDEARASALLAGLESARTVWVVVRRLEWFDPGNVVYDRLLAAGRSRKIVVRGEEPDYDETLSRFDLDAATVRAEGSEAR